MRAGSAPPRIYHLLPATTSDTLLFVTPSEERKEIDDAHFLTGTESKSADYVCQVYYAQSGTLWTKP